MNKKFTTSQITLLGLMIAILLLMAYTPLGYLNIGPLAITFNIIPVAISAITMGPVGGAIAEPYSDLPALDSVSALAVPALWVLPYSESIHSWRLFRDLFQDWLTDFFLDIFSRESAENQKIFIFPAL